MAEPVGTIDVALSHTARLLERNSTLAAEQAAEILKVAPRHPSALLLLGVAQRRGGRTRAALETFATLTRDQPNWATAQYEHALALADAGEYAASVASLRRAVTLKPDMADAWRALGDQLTNSGDLAGADAAYAQQIKASTRDPQLLAAAAALCENQIPQAEALLKAHLKQHPTDVAALRMLAEVAARLQRFEDAEVLLARCLELAPSFVVLVQDQLQDIADPDERALRALGLVGALTSLFIGYLDGTVTVPRERLIRHCLGLLDRASRP